MFTVQFLFIEKSDHTSGRQPVWKWAGASHMYELVSVQSAQ